MPAKINTAASDEYSSDAIAMMRQDIETLRGQIKYYADAPGIKPERRNEFLQSYNLQLKDLQFELQTAETLWQQEQEANKQALEERLKARIAAEEQARINLQNAKDEDTHNRATRQSRGMEAAQLEDQNGLPQSKGKAARQYFSESPFLPTDYWEAILKLRDQSQTFSKEERKFIALASLGEEKIKQYRKGDMRSKRGWESQEAILFGVRECFRWKIKNGKLIRANFAACWEGDILHITRFMLADKVGTCGTKDIITEKLKSLEASGVITRQYRYFGDRKTNAIEGKELRLIWNEKVWQKLVARGQELIASGIDKLATRFQAARVHKLGGAKGTKIAIEPLRNCRNNNALQQNAQAQNQHSVGFQDNCDVNTSRATGYSDVNKKSPNADAPAYINTTVSVASISVASGSMHEGFKTHKKGAVARESSILGSNVPNFSEKGRNTKPLTPGTLISPSNARQYAPASLAARPGTSARASEPTPTVTGFPPPLSHDQAALNPVSSAVEAPTIDSDALEGISTPADASKRVLGHFTSPLEAELTAEAEDLKAFAAQAAMKARAMLDSRDAQNEPEEAQPLEWSKLNTGALPGNQVSISTEPGILAPGNQVYVWLKPEDDLMKVATYEYSNTTLRILSLLQRNDDEMEFRKSDLAFYKESYTFETCRLIDYRVRKAQSQMTVESVTAWLDIRNTNRDAVDNHWEFKITELQHLVRNWDQIALLIKHTAHKIDLVADMGYRFSGQQIMNQRELLKQYPTLLPEKQRAMQEEYAAAIDLLSAREAAEQAFRMQYGQLEASRPYHNEDPITNTNYDNA